ncbi:MAG: recombinase RecR [Sulfurovum sp. FS08-3]|nr:MAG: recombinase RecR [Sulfurovum sp. FS08-3]
MAKKLDAFERLVEALEGLPSIGKKSAIRLAYHMTIVDGFGAMKLSHAIEHALSIIRTCKKCHNISEDELCAICSDPIRDRSKLCIVQSAKDIMSIEESGEYHGLYYIINRLEYLDDRHLKGTVEGIEEVIFAFSPSIATDTMMLYIEDRLRDHPLRFTKIAQGVPIGVELENIDKISLSRALNARIEL